MEQGLETRKLAINAGDAFAELRKMMTETVVKIGYDCNPPDIGEGAALIAGKNVDRGGGTSAYAILA